MLQNETNVRLHNSLKHNNNSNNYSIQTIDITHQHIHDGEFFTANYEELAVANNGVVRLRITTSAINYCHLVIDGSVEGKVRFKTYAGSTYTVAGTTADATKLTVFNRNSGGGVPGTTIRYNPTPNVLGALRGLQTIFAGTGPKTTGGSNGSREETVLLANTDILIVITNVSGSAQDINVVLNWYE